MSMHRLNDDYVFALFSDDDKFLKVRYYGGYLYCNREFDELSCNSSHMCDRCFSGVCLYSFSKCRSLTLKLAKPKLSDYNIVFVSGEQGVLNF